MISFMTTWKNFSTSYCVNYLDFEKKSTDTLNKHAPNKINDTHREKLNLVQEFIKIKSWLLLIFSTCLHNPLKLYNLIKSTDA